MTWGDTATPFTAMGKAAGATLAFRVGGELRVAAVVKATFILAPDAPMLLVDPEPILRADQLRDTSPAASLVAAGDLVPYRPRADVLLSGSARAPQGRPTPAMAVRLMVARGHEVVLDKRLAVRGTPDPTGRTREPAPFAAMQFAWELAAGSPDNPVGIREGPGGWPHIVDPRQRERPAGFGPISPRWPPRRRLLKLDERAFAAAIPDLPRDFAWAYFNAAPEDQRLDFFRGDEWVGFEGMHSQLPRVQSCLPGVRARARVYGPSPERRGGEPLALEADTLILDADRLRCSVVWRGSFVVGGAGEQDLASLHVFAGVETVDQPLTFPASLGARASGSLPRPVVAPPADDSRTQDAPSMPASFAATPFERAPPAPRVNLVDDDDDDGLLADLVSTLPADARSPVGPALPFAASPRAASPRAASPGAPPPSSRLAGTMALDVFAFSEALPFERAGAPSEPRPAPPPPPPSTPHAGGTMDVGALLASRGLPFAGTPPAPPPSAPQAGGTMDVGVLLAASPLPFAPAPPGAPVPLASPSPRSAASSPSPQAGGTMDVGVLLAGNALPFGDAPAAPPPAPVSAPIPAAQPAFMRPAESPVATFQPVPAPPSILQDAPAPAPAPDELPGDPPQTLGAFFLAAMARAGKMQARLEG